MTLTGHENNTAQPKTDKCLSATSHCSLFYPLGPRPAAALSLRNPMRREVTVSNDPGIQPQKLIINSKQKFQLISYFSQFANTVCLYIQQVFILFFHSKIKEYKIK